MLIPVSAQSDPVLGGIYQRATGYGKYEVIYLDPLTLRDLEARTLENPITGEEIALPVGQGFRCDLSYFRAEFTLVG
jgi:hypothetical protein